jgi:GH25 family lysozyme M1 (1,4-beta-N-acetylmuramidase)
MPKIVIDSSNNRPINATELHESGAVALIAKATEGTSFRDSTLANQRSVARAVRVPFGSYLFLHPTSHGSEAQFYLDYARPRAGDIQPVIDAEVTNLGTDELARRSQSCAVALEHEGYAPILYASASIWKAMVAVQPKLKRLPVWEAAYPGRFTRWFPRLSALRIALTHGVRVVLWQWTDAYAVGNAHFDASALLVSLDSIRIRPKAASGGGGGKTTAA